MKKTAKILIAAALCACMTITTPSVCADMLYEPYKNDFYNSHFAECKYIEWRTYVVLNDCDIYTSPESQEKTDTFKAGDEVIVPYEYYDDEGRRWGCGHIPTDDVWAEDYWFLMDNMQLIYDHISFMEEHKNETRKYNGELNDFYAEKQVVLWKYPFSDRINTVMTPEEWAGYHIDPEEYLSLDNQASYVYNDINGNDWVYLWYYPNGWIYVPDPESDIVKTVENTAVLKENDGESENVTTAASVLTTVTTTLPSTEEMTVSTEKTSPSTEETTVSTEAAVTTIDQTDVSIEETSASVYTTSAVGSILHETKEPAPAVITEISVTEPVSEAPTTAEEQHGFIEDTPEPKSEARPDFTLPAVLAAAAAVISAVLILILKKRG